MQAKTGTKAVVRLVNRCLAPRSWAYNLPLLLFLSFFLFLSLSFSFLCAPPYVLSSGSSRFSLMIVHTVAHILPLPSLYSFLKRILKSNEIDLASAGEEVC
jgi:hypothetical protein